MRHKPLLRNAVAGVGVAVAALAATAAPAAASESSLGTTAYIREPTIVMHETVCEPNHEWTEIPDKASQSKLTHASRVFHNYNGSETKTETAEHRRTITASLTVSGEMEFEHNLIFSAASAKIGFAVGLEYETTSTSSESWSATFTENDTYVIWRGTTQWDGTYDHYRCNGRGTAVEHSHGTWTTFQTEPDRGILGCTTGKAPAPNTPEVEAKATYCPKPSGGTPSTGLLVNSSPGGTAYQL